MLTKLVLELPKIHLPLPPECLAQDYRYVPLRPTTLQKFIKLVQLDMFTSKQNIFQLKIKKSSSKLSDVRTREGKSRCLIMWWRHINSMLCMMIMYSVNLIIKKIHVFLFFPFVSTCPLSFLSF